MSLDRNDEVKALIRAMIPPELEYRYINDPILHARTRLLAEWWIDYVYALEP